MSYTGGSRKGSSSVLMPSSLVKKHRIPHKTVTAQSKQQLSSSYLIVMFWTEIEWLCKREEGKETRKKIDDCAYFLCLCVVLFRVLEPLYEGD